MVMNIDLKKKEEVDNRLATLCQAMGYALWECQGLEQILAKYYSVAFTLPERPSAEQIDSEFENNFSHTAGRLVSLLKKSAGEKEIYAARLEAFLKERNWLAHKLRRTDLLSIFSEETFNQLTSRVSAITNEATQLTIAFNQLMIEYFVSLGVSRPHIESKLEKELSKPYNS